MKKQKSEIRDQKSEIRNQGTRNIILNLRIENWKLDACNLKPET